MIHFQPLVRKELSGKSFHPCDDLAHSDMTFGWPEDTHSCEADLVQNVPGKQGPFLRDPFCSASREEGAVEEPGTLQTSSGQTGFPLTPGDTKIFFLEPSVGGNGSPRPLAATLYLMI